MPKFSRKTSGGKRSFKKRVYKKKPSKKTSFSSRVLKVVSKVAENKRVSVTASTYIYSGSAAVQINLVPNASTMLIAQGTGQGDRIGNKIKTKKVVMKYILYPIGYNATTNAAPCPAEVRAFIGRNKTSPAQPPAVGVSLFQNGDSTNGLTDGLADMIMPLNRDTTTVYKEIRHKVGNAAIAVSGGGGSTVNQHYSNNDFKLNIMRTLDVTKYVPATLTYNDGITAPTTPASFFNIWYARADNTGGASSTTAYAIWYSIQYEFEDY